MAFDIIEAITLLMALVVFFLIFGVYVKNRKKKISRAVIFSFIGAYFFILLNRIFTVVEGFYFGEMFNVMEHVSIILSAIFFVYAALSIQKGEKK